MKHRRIVVNNTTNTWTMEYVINAYPGEHEGGYMDTEALKEVLEMYDPGDYYNVRFEPYELGRIREDRTKH